MGDHTSVPFPADTDPGDQLTFVSPTHAPNFCLLSWEGSLAVRQSPGSLSSDPLSSSRSNTAQDNF